MDRRPRRNLPRCIAWFPAYRYARRARLPSIWQSNPWTGRPRCCQMYRLCWRTAAFAHIKSDSPAMRVRPPPLIAICGLVCTATDATVPLAGQPSHQVLISGAGTVGRRSDPFLAGHMKLSIDIAALPGGIGVHPSRRSILLLVTICLNWRRCTATQPVGWTMGAKRHRLAGAFVCGNRYSLPPPG